jgi:hypothetical protein
MSEHVARAGRDHLFRFVGRLTRTVQKSPFGDWSRKPALLVLASALGSIGCSPVRSPTKERFERAERPLATRNAAIAELVGASAVAEAAPRGYALTGAGVQVGVWDEGHARASHVDLRGRVVSRDLGGLGEHATHTTATIAGSGTGSIEARGMAPDARIWAYDWQLDLGEIEGVAAGLSVSSNAYGLTMGWAVEPKCPEHPTWWGGQGVRQDPAFGRYGADAAGVDALVLHTDLLMVWPVGNERMDTGVAAGEAHFHAGSCSELFDDAHVQELTLQYRTLGGAAVAKNALTVGAARAVPRSALDAARIGALGMSSFGPTDDGRIKPELLAGGEAVRSASARSDEAYATMSGSSSATAATAGVIALLIEHYRKTHGGADPRAPELKALLVQSAREAGAAGPDYGSGYGLLDAQAAADLIADDGALGSSSRRLVVATLDDSGPLELTTDEVPAGAAVRVTLAWSDPAARPSAGASDDAALTLVNDLDLVLTAPDGKTVFHPWTLDPARPSAAPTRSAPNRRDNLEVVDVDADANRVAGRWRVRVELHGPLWRGQPQSLALAASVPIEVPSQLALALPRYVEVTATRGQMVPPVHVPLSNRGGGSTSFQARSLTPWLAVRPAAGSAPAELTLEIDQAVLDETGCEQLGRVQIDSDDPAGPRVLGVVVRTACEPDCSGRNCGPDPSCGQTCGNCDAAMYCRDGACAAWGPSCPQAELGSELGLSLLSGGAAMATGHETGSCGGDMATDVGVSFIAPAAGRYAFTTRGSDFDTLLYVRDGGCKGTELACNDDSASTASAVALELAAGQQVTAFVDAVGALGNGRFALNVEPAPCSDVDLGSRLGQGLVRASTFGGIDRLAGSCGGRGSEDVSFRWSAPAAGRYRFSLFEPRFAAVLYVRDGGCDGAELGCSAATDVGPVELALAQGQSVVVVVDGRPGRSGSFALDIVDVAAVCDASCGGPAVAGSCSCDASCVGAGDCCADACSRCGLCRCQRACSGKKCGPDGCGGSCGECAGGERCEDSGSCAADPCAGVVCDPCSACVAGRCAPLAEGAACEDGDLCTVLDACHGGACAGEAVDCDDGFVCTRDRCDSSSGECQHRQDASCCEPPCTDAGACELGADGCVAQLADAGPRPSSTDAGAPASRAKLKPRRGGGCGCAVVGARSRPASPSWQLALIWLALARRRRLQGDDPQALSR